MDNRKADSLQKAWGIDRQDNWQFLKKLTVLAATKYYQQDNPTYNEFYQFIANKRHEIATALHQDDAHLMGVFRNPSKFMVTHMSDEGRYASYFPYLLKRYEEIKTKTVVLPVKEAT